MTYFFLTYQILLTITTNSPKNPQKCHSNKLKEFKPKITNHNVEKLALMFMIKL